MPANLRSLSLSKTGGLLLASHSPRWRRIAGPMRTAKNAVFWKVYGHGWMSWEAPFCTSWRRRSMAQQREESGDRRSHKPVTVLVCIARLTFMNSTTPSKLFLINSKDVHSKVYLGEFPEWSKVWSVCAALLLRLDVNSTGGFTEGRKAVAYTDLQKRTSEMLTLGEREKKGRTRLPQGWTTDLQKQSLMCCPLGHASNETRCKSLAYNAWASTSICLCVCVAFVVFHKFGGSDNVRSSQNDLADEPRRASTTRN